MLKLKGPPAKLQNNLVSIQPMITKADWDVCSMCLDV